MSSNRDRRTLGLIVGLVALAVIGPLVFWVAGNLLGVVYIVAVIALVAYFATRRDTGGEVEVAPSPDRRHRALVVAHAEAADGLISGELAGREAEVLVVVPALTTRTNRVTGEIDEAAGEAAAAAERMAAEAGRDGRAARGVVGDADPRTAVEDALRSFSADEVLVVPPPREDLEFFKVSQPEETFQGVRLPVTFLPRVGEG